MNVFGEKMRELRQARNMSLRTLAEVVRVSVSYLSDIERGKKRPPREEIVQAIEWALDAEDGALTDLAERQRNPPKLDSGWRCPVCGSVYAPTVPQCLNCGPSPRSYVWWWHWSESTPSTGDTLCNTRPIRPIHVTGISPANQEAESVIAYLEEEWYGKSGDNKTPTGEAE